MKFLLLEDNENLCKTIVKAFKKENYEVDVFMDGQEALFAIPNGYECFILDINVPSLDGISVLDYIRIHHKDVPIIIISSNYELETIKECYRYGCDDYLKKPFFIYELIKKIKLLCKETPKSIDLTDGYIYDLQTQTIKHNNEEIKLAKKEKLFLHLLAKNRNKAVSFEEIEEYVWQGEITTFSNIRALVKRLRRKIPNDAIKITKGLGYSLNI